MCVYLYGYTVNFAQCNCANAQIFDSVKNLTISQKLQNSNNGKIFTDNLYYLVNNYDKIVTKGGYISDKRLQNGNKIV